jgi:hypothetical protein
MLPQLNLVRALARAYAPSSDPVIRAAVVKAADKVMSQGSTYMDVSVGRSMFYTALKPDPGKDPQTPKITPTEMPALAEQLGNEIGEPDLATKLGRQSVRLQALLTDYPVDDAKLRILLNMNPVWSAAALSLIVFSLLGLALSHLRSNWSKLAPAAPYAVWGTAFAVSHVQPNNSLVPYFGLTMFIGFLAIREQTRRLASILGHTIAAICILLAFGIPALAIPAIGFVLGMHANIRRDSLPSWSLGLVAVLAGGAASYWPIQIALRHGVSDVIVFGGFAALCALFIVPPRKFAWLPAVGTVCLIAGSLYVVDTFRQVETNRQLEAVQRSYLTQVDDLRKQAGID